MTLLAFVDTETTGLDPDRHEIWEVGLIRRDPDDQTDTEYTWRLSVDLGKAEPIALTVGGYYRRQNDPNNHDPDKIAKSPTWFAHQFSELTHGAHLVGANPSFDDAFLKRLLRANGACPGWSYHLVDVEALAAGYLRGRARGLALDGDVLKYPGIIDTSKEVAPPPWSSSDLSRAVGVNPDDFERHTALGDARWARAIYDAVMSPTYVNTNPQLQEAAFA